MIISIRPITTGRESMAAMLSDLAPIASPRSLGRCSTLERRGRPLRRQEGSSPAEEPTRLEDLPSDVLNDIAAEDGPCGSRSPAKRTSSSPARPPATWPACGGACATCRGREFASSTRWSVQRDAAHRLPRQAREPRPWRGGEARRRRRAPPPLSQHHRLRRGPRERSEVPERFAMNCAWQRARVVTAALSFASTGEAAAA